MEVLKLFILYSRWIFRFCGTNLGIQPSQYDQEKNMVGINGKIFLISCFFLDPKD